MTSRHCQRYPQSYGINNSTSLLHIRTVVVSDGRLAVYMAGKQFVGVQRNSTWAMNLTWPIKAPVCKNIYFGILQHTARPSAPCTKRKSQASNNNIHCSPHWHFHFLYIQAKCPVFPQHLAAVCINITIYSSPTFKEEITFRL